MANLIKSKFVIFVFCIYLALLAWDAQLFLEGLKDSNFNFLFNIGYSTLFFSSSYLVLRNFNKIFDFNKKMCVLFFGLACTSFGVGLVIWAFYNLVLQIDVPFPSIVDLFFLSYYFLALFGAIYFLKSLRVPINKLFIYDSSVIFVLSLLVIVGIFNFIIKPQSENELAQVINTIYPVGSAVLVAIAVIALRLNVVKMRRPLIYIVFAFIFSTVADILFSLRTNLGVYWNGDISDLMFATDGLFYFLGLYALIHTDKTVESEVKTPAESSNLNP